VKPGVYFKVLHLVSMSSLPNRLRGISHILYTLSHQTYINSILETIKPSEDIWYSPQVLLWWIYCNVSIDLQWPDSYISTSHGTNVWS